jgi:hypothetical protein
VSGQSAKPVNKLTLKCAGPSGRTCTQENVKGLAAAAHMVTSGPRASLMSVKTISLNSDGTLKCQQSNGQRCTVEQAKSLYEIGRAINMTVTYSDVN